MRTIYITGQDRDENDSEHAYQLAIVAWYLNSTQKLGLNSDKLFKYALAHDLVEIYAGDTFFYTADKKQRSSKEDREHDSFEKIVSEFPEFVELKEAMLGYEKKADREAKFIYALDKILPPINIYLDGGRSWQRDEITYEMLKTKDEKVKLSPEVMKIWLEIRKTLEKDPEFDKLFYKPTK